MYKLETLNNSNLNLIHNFNITNEYKEELIEICNNKNIFKKLLFGKNIKFIKLYDKYIGFMWFTKLQHQSYKIHCIKIISEYSTIEYYKELFKFFNDYDSIAISDNNNLDKNLLVNLGFVVEKTIAEMKNNIDVVKEVVDDGGISFSTFTEGKDEGYRCSIQNLVFDSINRQEINEEDIIYEKYQKHYIPEGCIFIKYYHIPVGYGQLIKKDNKIYIANFGILPQYRRRGYGKLLLRHMLNIACSLGFNEIYLKCDSNNVNAVKLYKSEGFNSLETCYEYKRSKLNINC
ncbi:GNAT family N-acetyltransferase [Clostridium sp.]|uniref:GNAT family N-acetyltransferase n=1 Tax=Clostridium sp. TaxID=1506 RepID=UPI00321645CB